MPLRHPLAPPCSSRAASCRLCTTVSAFTLYVKAPGMYAVANTPATPLDANAPLFSNDDGHSRPRVGSARALPRSGPAQSSVALRPGYPLGRHTSIFIGGFGQLVALLPVASVATHGSNIWRVRLSPKGIPRFFTAHFRIRANHTVMYEALLLVFVNN